MTAITDFSSIATTLLGRTPTSEGLQRVGTALAKTDPYNKGNFTTDWEEVNSAGVDDGGTGYVVDDILTVVGGTGTAATLRVVEVNSGVIAGLTVETPGNYTSSPVSPNTVSGGTGSGASIILSMKPYSIARDPTNEEKAQLCLDSIKQFILLQLEESARATKAEELDVNRDTEIQTAIDTAKADFS